MKNYFELLKSLTPLFLIYRARREHLSRRKRDRLLYPFFSQRTLRTLRSISRTTQINMEGIMSILGCPISTFLAYIVAILSILVSIIWALVKKFPFEG
ncbi:MAG: hypothetical protein U9R01_02610 [candidate division WOR-3 bacterium]|nr:hypothetical protein [candidate division WOR-3 bacterium]